MASSVALKRARRAQQRKHAVALKRRLELVESALGPRSRQAAKTPIRRCVLQGEVVDGAIEGGMAAVVLARGRTPDFVTAAIFLVDTYCLGIKDIIFRDVDGETLALLCKQMSDAAPVAAVEPAYARKFLSDAAAWGASIGFKPHRDFVAAEQLFGDVRIDACNAAFTFGYEGRPFYLPGPTETRAQIRQRLAHLHAFLGPDGFDCALEL